MPSSTQRFARDVGLSFASLGISVLAHFILRLFLARHLGTGDLGLYTLAFTFYSFGMILSAFGIGLAVTKYVAEFKGNIPKTSLLLSSGSLTAPLIGCAMGWILYICSAPIANTFFDMPELGSLLRIVAFALPFIALEKVTLGFLRGLRRMRLFAFVNIAQNVLTVILTLALVVGGHGLSGAVLGLVLPLVLLSLFSLFSIRKSLAKPTLAQYTPAIKMLLIFGGYVVLANGIGMISAHADAIMIGYFLTDTDVGVYAVAIVLALAVSLPSQALQTITGPTMATHWGRREIGKIEDLINRIMKYTAVFTIPVAFVVAFLSSELINLVFGDAFTSAAVPLQILLIGAAFGAIHGSVGGALSSTAYVSMVFKLSAVTMVLNIILNLVLIPPLGIKGAAIATSTSTVSIVLLHLYFAQRLIGMRIHWEWFGTFLACTCLLAGATYGLGTIVNHYVCIPLALIVFVVVSLKFFVTREDLRLLRGIIPWGKTSQ